MIKSFTRGAFRGFSRTGTSPGEIPSHVVTPLPTELALVVQMTLEMAFQELQQLSQSCSAPMTCNSRQYFHPQHIELLPVGEFLKAVLCNPWSEMPIPDDMEFQRVLFNTAEHHYANFSSLVQEVQDEEVEEVASQEEFHTEPQETDEEKSDDQLVPATVLPESRTSDVDEHEFQNYKHRRRSQFKRPFVVIIFIALLHFAIYIAALNYPQWCDHVQSWLASPLATTMQPGLILQYVDIKEEVPFQFSRVLELSTSVKPFDLAFTTDSFKATTEWLSSLIPKSPDLARVQSALSMLAMSIAYMPPYLFQSSVVLWSYFCNFFNM